MNSQVIQIHQYRSEWKNYFRDLTVEWLLKYFSVTEEDEKILANPGKIISDGGVVLFATYRGEIAGTLALLKKDNQVVELIKMGVKESFHGHGIGKALMDAAILHAREMNAKIIFLETATKLTAAISLYKKAGFIQTGEEEIHPVFKRRTFRMELDLTKS